MKNKLFAIASGAVMILMINSVVLGAEGDLTVNGDLNVKGNLNFLPAGAMMMYGGSVAPTGWLIADGSEISRTTYAALFAAIGTTFGAGDGSITFNLPDFRRRVPVGAGGLGTETLWNAVGSAGGEENHKLSIPEMPSHYHMESIAAVNTWGPAAKVSSVFRGYYNNAGWGTNVDITSSSGGGTAHNNMQPSLVVNYIIKQ